ncbi:hypothetical protein CY34DRAFT_810868 [Suillus luteus UH-Slu-Lm8-n1]|uniref:Uncharacterized protein n=1 Tax=Suillus luteus UH-Slu-Lm8-n1 TaxID=930992 RepID=A0A0C9ZHM5_9AGAM|nr:hypothetical protein CY34DRAFT_810868 [Suillus luteus UH-Slu-Lm8-n1]
MSCMIAYSSSCLLEYRLERGEFAKYGRVFANKLERHDIYDVCQNTQIIKEFQRNSKK